MSDDGVPSPSASPSTKMEVGRSPPSASPSAAVTRTPETRAGSAGGDSVPPELTAVLALEDVALPVELMVDALLGDGSAQQLDGGEQLKQLRALTEAQVRERLSGAGSSMPWLINLANRVVTALTEPPPDISTSPSAEAMIRPVARRRGSAGDAQVVSLDQLPSEFDLEQRGLIAQTFVRHIERRERTKSGLSPHSAGDASSVGGEAQTTTSDARASDTRASDTASVVEMQVHRHSLESWLEPAKEDLKREVVHALLEPVAAYERENELGEKVAHRALSLCPRCRAYAPDAVFAYECSSGVRSSSLV